MCLKKYIKMSIDILMTIMFVVLMSYPVTGNILHEWLGIGIFVLFILHNILNLKWYKAIGKGQYSRSRTFHTIINIMLLISMFGMMLSGILISRDALEFLQLNSGMFGRELHLVSTAWGFILTAMHCGLHINTKKIKTKSNKPFMIIASILIGFMSLYGIFSFITNKLYERLFLITHYAYFNFDKSPIEFFGEYIAILILFSFISYQVKKLLSARR